MLTRSFQVYPNQYAEKDRGYYIVGVLSFFNGEDVTSQQRVAQDGEVAERLNATVLKTVTANHRRGFKSHPLRHHGAVAQRWKST